MLYEVHHTDNTTDQEVDGRYIESHCSQREIKSICRLTGREGDLTRQQIANLCDHGSEDGNAVVEQAAPIEEGFRLPWKQESHGVWYAETQGDGPDYAVKEFSHLSFALCEMDKTGAEKVLREGYHSAQDAMRDADRLVAGEGLFRA